MHFATSLCCERKQATVRDVSFSLRHRMAMLFTCLLSAMSVWAGEIDQQRLQTAYTCLSQYRVLLLPGTPGMLRTPEMFDAQRMKDYRVKARQWFDWLRNTTRLPAEKIERQVGSEQEKLLRLVHFSAEQGGENLEYLRTSLQVGLQHCDRALATLYTTPRQEPSIPVLTPEQATIAERCHARLERQSLRLDAALVFGKMVSPSLGSDPKEVNRQDEHRSEENHWKRQVLERILAAQQPPRSPPFMEGYSAISERDDLQWQIDENTRKTEAWYEADRRAGRQNTVQQGKRLAELNQLTRQQRALATRMEQLVRMETMETRQCDLWIYMTTGEDGPKQQPR